MNKSKVVNSFVWRLAERFGAQGVTLVVSIILARLIDPSVYGTLALVTVFTSILQVFVDSGLGTALIQKKDADDLDFSSVFFFNLFMCALIYILLFFCAPYIAKFYKLPELINVIRVLGIIIIISGVKNIQQAYISRKMLFKRFFFATLGGTICAALIGIYMAWKGYGVWSLVAQYLINAMVDTLILWITVKWRPKLCFSIKRLKSLLSFGYKLLGVSLISTIYNNIRSLIIGRLYSSADLAFYNKAEQFPLLIAMNVDGSIDSVLLPIMSQSQDNKVAIKKMARTAIKTETYVMMPIMAGLAACAAPLIRLLMTEKWMPCVPFVRVFCITYAFFSIFTTNYNVYKSLGRSDVYLKVTMAGKIFGVLVLLFTMKISVMAIAYGLTLLNLINQIMCSYSSKRLIGYSYREQVLDILPNILTATLMGGCVFAISFLGMGDLVTLIIQVVSGVVLYIVLSVITKNQNYHFIIEMICERLKIKTKSTGL